MNALSTAERQAVHGLLWQGCGAATIADCLGLPKGAVLGEVRALIPADSANSPREAGSSPSRLSPSQLSPCGSPPAAAPSAPPAPPVPVAPLSSQGNQGEGAAESSGRSIGPARARRVEALLQAIAALGPDARNGELAEELTGFGALTSHVVQ